MSQAVHNSGDTLFLGQRDDASHKVSPETVCRSVQSADQGGISMEGVRRKIPLMSSHDRTKTHLRRRLERLGTNCYTLSYQEQ